MERSRINKSAGNVFLFGGLGIALTGIMIGGGSGDSKDGPKDIDFTGPAVFLVGLGCAFISIPFYISSRHRALEISAGTIRVRESPGLSENSGVLQPGAVLRIQIR